MISSFFYTLSSYVQRFNFAEISFAFSPRDVDFSRARRDVTNRIRLSSQKEHSREEGVEEISTCRRDEKCSSVRYSFVEFSAPSPRLRARFSQNATETLGRRQNSRIKIITLVNPPTYPPPLCILTYTYIIRDAPPEMCRVTGNEKRTNFVFVFVFFSSNGGGR